MNNFSVVNTIKALTMLELPDDREITEDMIKGNYHKLCLIYHPDQANERYKDGEKFCQLMEARDYLTTYLPAVNNQIRTQFQDISFSNKKESYYRYYRQEEDKKQQAEAAKRAEESYYRAEAMRKAEYMKKEKERTDAKRKERQKNISLAVTTIFIIVVLFYDLSVKRV